ncbi:amidase family protein [Streptomyces himastatinicus]|uniref:amidase family protein n=1 Tax=Streptomyces himastatinicus TaxID=998084 RepID=UPI00142F2FA3|nr:amidase family protein [Streptomyces himastatinicus]
MTTATVLTALIRSRSVSPTEVVPASLERIERLDPAVNAVVSVFVEAGLLITPVNAVTGVRNGPTGNTVGPRQVEDEEVDAYAGWSLTIPCTVMGGPAATVPAGRATNRVPMGMQIAAQRHSDSTVVHAAAALEAQSPWHDDYRRVWHPLAATGRSAGALSTVTRKGFDRS